MNEQRQPILFVSHPSSKADTALHIERALNARGVRCWMAPRDVEPGEQWDVAIRKAISTTDAMLLLFCGDSERSRQVKRELILADQSHKPIIPMRLERIEPQELSYHLADSQWIDWIEQRDEAIERVAAKARDFQNQRDDAIDRVAAQARDFQHRREGTPPPAPVSAPFAPAPPAYPPFPPPPAPPAKSLAWLWITLGGLVTAGLIGFGIWWFATRPSAIEVTEEWFAGVWAESSDCTLPYRFDLGGLLTGPDGSQGQWYIEEGDTLVIVGPDGETERRMFTEVSDDMIVSSSGRAYRCFGGST